jgi:hypothetical protein
MLVQLIGEKESTHSWSIVEFQGDLIPGNHHDDILGKIIVKGNVATLELDNQLLEGQVVRLERPILITSNDQGNSNSVLNLVAVVQKKILFNLRPQPRIS